MIMPPGIDGLETYRQIFPHYDDYRQEVGERLQASFDVEALQALLDQPNVDDPAQQEAFAMYRYAPHSSITSLAMAWS